MLFPWMCWHVLFIIKYSCEGRDTLSAMLRFYPWMSEHVPFEWTRVFAGILALSAIKGLFSWMGSLVAFETRSCCIRIFALWTNKGFLSTVNSHVDFQLRRFVTKVAALVAILLQISAFFIFSNFRKGRLLYIRPVGWLVGRLASPLFFSIYTGIEAFY